MAVVVDRALCLRRIPFSESSLVVHVLTARHGHVALLARGAYRSTSRYFAVLDLFDVLELEWDASARGELRLLRAGSIVERRREVRRDLERYRVALAVLEYADLATRHAHADPRLYELVDRALAELEEPDLRPDLVLSIFEFAYLEHLGLAPALETCAACGREAAPVVRGSRPRVAFSAGVGGRLCRRCADEARSSGRRVGTLPADVLDLGRQLAERGARISPLPDRASIERVRDFTGRFLDYHLEARPKSQRAFLAIPNRNAPPARGGQDIA